MAGKPPPVSTLKSIHRRALPPHTPPQTAPPHRRRLPSSPSSPEQPYPGFTPRWTTGLMPQHLPSPKFARHYTSSFPTAGQLPPRS
ncbi:unnamed protein product [Triticum turgidum subsp. durum]|uniref:Uncharacterized protein n=1 Tax=Triticum turgidum subsp. durum TaxID=4567 RepID=A0A9R0RGM4_TRITD|nr:unnamed protein product [Triticum turgidum subsp. durum]